MLDNIFRLLNLNQIIMLKEQNARSLYQ